MENQKLSKEDLENISDFEKHAKDGEDLQILDLDQNCNSSFQYAKTYSNYVKDWERTKSRMLEQLNTGNLPPDTSPELHEAMFEALDRVMEYKLEKVRNNFQNKFGESIFNYLGQDGKTKNNPILLIVIIIIIALLLF